MTGITRRAALRGLGAGVLPALLVRRSSAASAAEDRSKATDHRRILVLTGGSASRPLRYRVAFSGEADRTTDTAGAPVERATVDPEDHVVSWPDGRTSASGTLAGGADAYRFAGSIDGIGVSTTRDRLDDVGVYLDGDRAPLARLGVAPPGPTPVEFVDCTSAVVEGRFESVELHATQVAGDGGIATDRFDEGPVSGRITLDVHEYLPPASALDSVVVRPSWDAPGTPARNPFSGVWCLEHPSVTHTLVVAGGSPAEPARYELTPYATIRKTTDTGGAPVERATIDPEDDTTGATVRGAVAGGADAYVYTGATPDVTISGDARVYVDGRQTDLGRVGGSDRPG